MRRYYQRRLPSDMTKDYYYMLRNTPNAETVIVEYGFIDNSKDAKKLRENYKDYADAVIEAVLEYKNIPISETGYYTVKKGDSLWSIANKYNTTVNELKTLNNLSSNTLSIGQKLKIPNYDIDENDEIEIPSLPITYTVKSGDTLYKIANNYGVTVDELKEFNNLTSNLLSIGQVLKIPGINLEIPNTYVVEKGDTLYGIANKYNVSVNDIKSLNNLTSNTLSIGQVLLLPGSIEEDIADLLIKDYDYYTVKKGDTLYSISNKYGISVDELKLLNNLTSNTLSIGELLKVPISRDNIYTIKKGDTLWSIANENNTTVDKLKEINNLIDNSLTIGQQILLN